MKRATFGVRERLIFRQHFNPRPHEEGDEFGQYATAASQQISIHALMKRATSLAIPAVPHHTISIHALMKRATSPMRFSGILSQYFNPRPHEEGDPRLFQKLSYNVISIHALMKRATQLSNRCQRNFPHFNPRPHEEGDYNTLSLICQYFLFQSTPS